MKKLLLLQLLCVYSFLFSFQVKESLAVLIHHHLITHKKYKNVITEYHLELDLIWNRKRFQKYVYFAKLKFGDIAELTIKTLLLNVCDILSHVAKGVTDRLEVGDNEEEERPDGLTVIQKCRHLVMGNFIKRAQNPFKETEEIEEKELFAIPSGNAYNR